MPRAVEFNINNAPTDPQARFDLAKKLKDNNNIGGARLLLQTTNIERLPLDSPLRFKIIVQLANCTAKDQELNTDERLKTAQELLEGALIGMPDIEHIHDNPVNEALLVEMQDALGVLGAVHKQRWSVYGFREHLEKALVYYEAGYRLGLQLKYGTYNGINAAFVLDVLAAQPQSPEPGRERELMERWGARASNQAAEQAADPLRRRAAVIRQEIIDALLPQGTAEAGDYWLYATLGEAYLGLGGYNESCKWMEKASALELENWQWESTARQIAQLARLRAAQDRIPAAEFKDSSPWQVVRALLRNNDAAADSFFRGKVGLALSGGGFRASLYHIGVLARLAELDMLRHVEVISCVSGGSILGAYYYLKLKKLLDASPSDNIPQEDYIRMIAEIESEFLASIQKNLRLRMLAGFRSNLKVLTSTQSSTSHRLGDLYESELYGPIMNKSKRQPCYIDELKVNPSGQRDFSPKYNNWHRSAKVPILILNATTLNTCHNWQFTATYMGEPPLGSIDREIDANDRLRRMWYREAPPDYRDGAKRIRLGHAVAASACVPGLFDPITLDGLYEKEYVTRLVDGGVFDNQGIASLTEQGCTVLLVSDASGQTGVEMDPPTGNISVAMRANNVLMTRVRETEYKLLASLRDSSLLRGLMYVHLKKGLEAHAVDWIGGTPKDEPARAGDTDVNQRSILPAIQRRLAAIRTDLDAFSDAEADALMLSGYRMTEQSFPLSIPDFPTSAAPGPWRFLEIAEVAEVRNHVDFPALDRTLDAAHFEGFKAFRLWAGFPVLVGAIRVLLFALAAAALSGFVFAPEYTSRAVISCALALVAISSIVWVFRRWKHYRNPLWQVLLAVPMIAVGWIYLRIHLRFVDPIYLRSGPKYRTTNHRASAAAVSDVGTAVKS